MHLARFPRVQLGHFATPLEKLENLTREDAIFPDPGYCCNGMAGMIGLINKCMLKKGENVVFIHTGGTAVSAAYEHLFSKQSAA